MVRRTSRLVLLALVALCVVQTGRDVGRFDPAPRITQERRLGAGDAIAPSKGGRVELERGRDAKPGDLVPIAIGPADPAAPAGGWHQGALAAPVDTWQGTAVPGSSRPRAPPVV
jgi:hypothetical protein